VFIVAVIISHPFDRSASTSIKLPMLTVGGDGLPSWGRPSSVCWAAREGDFLRCAEWITVIIGSPFSNCHNLKLVKYS